MKKKVCFKCNRIKTVAEFYRHSQMSDGYLNKCKVCTKKDCNLHRKAKIEYYRNYDRRRANRPDRVLARLNYSQTERGKQRITLAKYNYSHRHPERRKATQAVNNALRDGRLTRCACSICGETKSQAHHQNYMRPLDVVWLCKKHHDKVHTAGKRL